MKKSSTAQNALDLSFEEDSILAGIIAGGKDHFAETIDVLSEKTFEIRDNKIVYQCCYELFEENKSINSGAVASKCKEYNVDLFKLPILTIVPAELSSARELALKLKSRLAIKESTNLHRAAIDKLAQMSATENIQNIFSVSESTLFDLISKFSTSNEDVLHFKSVARDLVNYWGSNPSENVGLPTPWPRFNKSIGGGMRTGVTLIGARSGVGKTSISVVIANYLASQDVPVLILDTEMEYKDILPRILSNMSEVEISKIESGSFSQSDFETKALSGALTKLEQSPLYYKSVAGSSFNEILSTIRRFIYTTVGLNKEGKANQCLIIYDYFKIMDSGDISDMQEYQAMGFQISKLTDFCKMFDIPCLSFVQLNRDGVAKEGTDVIAQSDRLLWLCNSFSIFKPKTAEEMDMDDYSNGNRKMITLKSRYGGENVYGEYIPMQWKGNICSLKEVTEKNNVGPDK